MSADWVEMPLGDFIELKRGYDLPKKSRQVGDVPLISSAGLSDYHSEAKVKGPGVITGRYGTIGEVFYVEDDFWPLNTTLYVKDFKGNYPRFVAYLLQTVDFNQYSDKAAVPGINRNHLHMAQIRVPKLLSQQVVIADYLSVIEEKILLNTQTNQTLEQMAQALFKSWFVDFDPVIDNALDSGFFEREFEGQDIPEPLAQRVAIRQALRETACANADSAAIGGLPPETRALFPDSFEEHPELGWIPKGWVATNVGSAFDVTMGQSPPSSTYNEGGQGVIFFQGRAEFGDRYPTQRLFCTEPKRMAKKGSTLVSVRAPVGDINQATDDCCIGRGLASVLHKSGSKSFSYYAMWSLQARFAVFESQGTVFGSINQRDFKGLPHIAPSETLVSKFEEVVALMDERLLINFHNSRTLSNLRDTLLPKLLSGELTLSTLEPVESSISA